jgi:photosystem II stability/assembly factor-like uncharacterized protein
MKICPLFILIILIPNIGQHIFAQKSLNTNQQIIANQKWELNNKSNLVLLKKYKTNNKVDRENYSLKKTITNSFYNTNFHTGLFKKSNNKQDSVWLKMNGPYGGCVRQFYNFNNKIYSRTDREIFVYENLSWQSLNFESIACDMINSMTVLKSGRILVSCDSGPFFSDNNGIYWMGISIMNSRCTPYDFYQNEDGSILLSTSNGIYISRNDGQTFLSLTLSNIIVYTINIDYSGNIWAGTDSGILKAKYNVLNWQKINIDSTYYTKIIFDSNNVVYTFSQNKFFKSSDSGDTWYSIQGPHVQDITLGENKTLIITTFYQILFANYEGVQSVSQMFDTDLLTTYNLSNNNKLLIGTLGSGAWKYDMKQGIINNFSNGMTAATIRAIVSMTNGEILACTDADSFYVSKDNGLTWNSTYYAWSMSMKSGNDGSVYAGVESGLIKSSDFGRTWINLNINVPINAVDISNDNRVICAGHGNGEVYVSLDAGENFQLMQFGSDDLIDAIKILNNNTFLIQTDQGHLYFTNDMGKTLTVINDSLGFGVNEFVIDYQGYIYHACNNGVFRSLDGIHWSSVSGIVSEDISWNLTDTWFIQIDKFNNIYAATWDGVIFCSTDRCKSWNQISPSFYGFFFWSFALTPDGYIFYGSQNEGLYREKIEITKKIAGDPKIFLLQNFPNPFNTMTKIEYIIPNDSYVEIKIYDIIGREVETLVSEKKTTGIYFSFWNAAKYSSGIYFYRLKVGNEYNIKKMVLLK